MAQKRENKDETVDLKVPTETLSISPRPDNFKMGGLDPSRIESVNTEIRIRRSHKLRPQTQDLATSGSEHTVSGDKKAVNRCCGCGKRVRLTGFRCRCGDLFCWEHRYSDRHDCSFDYKAAGREAIARENPLVRAAKILKV